MLKKVFWVCFKCFKGVFVAFRLATFRAFLNFKFSLGSIS